MSQNCQFVNKCSSPDTHPERIGRRTDRQTDKTDKQAGSPIDQGMDQQRQRDAIRRGFNCQVGRNSINLRFD